MTIGTVFQYEDPAGWQVDFNGETIHGMIARRQLKKLGAGNDGIIFKYETTRNDGQKLRIAAKEIKTTRAVLSEIESELATDMADNRLLQHDNIIRMYCAVKFDTSVYILMDICNGHIERFCKIVRNSSINQVLPEVVASRIFAAIIDGLLFLYNKGLYHGNIRPSNVLFQTKKPKYGTTFMLSDFSSTVRQASSKLSGATVKDSGKVYDSPERAFLPSDTITQTHDIWCVGVTVNEIVTGSHPFKNASLTNNAARQRHLRNLYEQDMAPAYAAACPLAPATCTGYSEEFHNMYKNINQADHNRRYRYKCRGDEVGKRLDNYTGLESGIEQDPVYTKHNNAVFSDSTNELRSRFDGIVADAFKKK